MQTVEIFWATIQGPLIDKDVQSELYQGCSSLEDPLVIVPKSPVGGPTRLFENLMSAVAGYSSLDHDLLTDGKLGTVSGDIDEKTAWGALTVMSKVVRGGRKAGIKGSSKELKSTKARNGALDDKLQWQMPKMMPNDNLIIINRDILREDTFFWGYPEMVMYSADDKSVWIYHEATKKLEDFL